MWIAIIGVLIIVVIALIGVDTSSGSPKIDTSKSPISKTKIQALREQMRILKEMDYEKQKISTEKYIAGHPDIDNACDKSAFYFKDGILDLYIEESHTVATKKAEIETKFVKNILVEDQSTVEKRVTVGRLLMTGIFAFAWKKKKVTEIAYLTIEWNDGRFDHETIFEFNGQGAMQKANTSRNALIKIVR